MQQGDLWLVRKTAQATRRDEVTRTLQYRAQMREGGSREGGAGWMEVYLCTRTHFVHGVVERSEAVKDSKREEGGVGG